MKKITLLFALIAVCVATSIAQVTQIKGVTKGRTSVYLGEGSNTVEKLPGNLTVDIIDADDTYFTIKYKDGKAYVIRTDLKFSYSELRELNKSKKDITSVIPIATPSSEISQTYSTTTDITNIDDKYKYEIDHIRYCAGKFHNQMMSGFALTMVGTIVIGASGFVDEPKIPMGIGAGIGLIGSIFIIDSNKWMKKIAIGPNGIGIKYVF